MAFHIPFEADRSPLVIASLGPASLEVFASWEVTGTLAADNLALAFIAWAFAALAFAALASIALASIAVALAFGWLPYFAVAVTVIAEQLALALLL